MSTPVARPTADAIRMRWHARPVAALALVISLAAVGIVRGDEPSVASGDAELSARLTFSCTAGNDLYQSLIAAGATPRRCDSPSEAIALARPDSAVLLMADDYPGKPIPVSGEMLAEASSKRLRLYIECPESLPGVAFGPPRRVHWERAVVASSSIDLGLPPLRILSLHDCSFRPAKVESLSLVVARVAGFDTAVYGLPEERFPILFTSPDGHLVATTKLSDFNKARSAPAADWPIIWQHILANLDPKGAPHKLVVAPLVRPTFNKRDPLPKEADLQALSRLANWVKNSRLLIPREREHQIHALLRGGAEERPLPSADEPMGDGAAGILEGYASRIGPDGSQTQRIPIRADCQAESAAVLAMHAMLTGDESSKRIAKNLLDYLYFDSELHQGVRGDPRHPAFGLIAWGAVAPAWQVANYGDDNARTLLATMAAAAALRSDSWDESMLKALLANLRTTGKLGFRGDRIDIAQLEQHGWRHFREQELINLSPHFEAYLWACHLWAYNQTGDRDFLDRTKLAIRMTMAAYPQGWRWGENIERGHMLLALAFLVRVEDNAEHRGWLQRIADDILADQQPCGAIAERVTGAGAGHYVVPASNDAYGTSETPLIQNNGDPVSDQLYTTGFVLLGLHEAAAATGEVELKRAEDKLADYLVRIQVRADALPFLDGAWFRAFDFNRWDYWASSADMGWGAWSAEAGWGPAWNGIVLGLRSKGTSLWELTAGSGIEQRLSNIKKLMSANKDKSWTGDPTE